MAEEIMNSSAKVSQSRLDVDTEQQRHREGSLISPRAISNLSLRNTAKEIAWGRQQELNCSPKLLLTLLISAALSPIDSF